MFTGIITDIGTVAAIDKTGEWKFTLRTNYAPESIEIGASIACSGICLTVVERGRDSHSPWFAVEASAETRERTTLKSWAEGTHINLERALKMGDDLGGHMVSGHVDGLATLISVTPVGDSRRLVLEPPADLRYLIAAKGSVALDGVSLTVNETSGPHFSVNIIPHTLAHTTLRERKAGEALNLEIDLIARYLARLNER